MAILKKTYPLILLTLLLAGCTEIFTSEIDIKPVLCLNSLITAGEPIEVSVTRTWLYTDENSMQYHQVDDATVAIYANGMAKSADYIPQEGDRIRIVAESPTYGSAEAEVTVPVCVPVESLTWEAEIIDRWESEDRGVANYTYGFNLRAKMTIKDPAEMENYYQFSYRGFPEEVEDDTVIQPVVFYSGILNDEAEPIFSEHIGAFDAISGSSAYGFTFFTDRRFSGKSYTLNLQFNGMAYGVRSVDYSEDLLNCGLVMTLSTVSSSYYNWSNYLWNINYGTIGDLNDTGLGDPIWGYSNVSTGAGVVAAQSQASCTINLKDFLKKEISAAIHDQ